MPARSPSPALLRAAQAESERIDRALAVLGQRRAALAAQIAELDAEAAALHERLDLLAQLGGVRDAPAASAAPAPAARALKGRDLRRIAGRLLWDAQAEAEIHYREWFERILHAGYAVGGKDPAASFLTNVRDSRAVVRGSRAGYYRLDAASRGRLAGELAEARAELADVAGVIERSGYGGEGRQRLDDLRAHRDRLAQRVRRLEAEAEELEAIFGGAARSEGPALAAA